MVLVDTSVWIEHLRRGDSNFAHLLTEGQVLMHPFVVGELSCGNLKDRAESLSYLKELPGTKVATHEEVLRLIEDRRLSGRGLGWIDVHLLASSLLSHCRFWTLDAKLGKAAVELGLA